MHRTQGDTSRAPRSAAEPQRDVWRGRVRTHLACPTPDEEGFRVADRSGPAATPARTRNKESRRSAGEMKMFRGQQYRCAYLTSEAIERFAVRGLAQLDCRVAIPQPENAFGQLADEEIFQRSVGSIATSEPDNTRRRAKPVHHFCKVGILRHDGCVSRSCRSEDRRVEGVTQPKVAH